MSIVPSQNGYNQNQTITKQILSVNRYIVKPQMFVYYIEVAFIWRNDAISYTEFPQVCLKFLTHITQYVKSHHFHNIWVRSNVVRVLQTYRIRSGRRWEISSKIGAQRENGYIYLQRRVTQAVDPGSLA